MGKRALDYFQIRVESMASISLLAFFALFGFLVVELVTRAFV